MDEIKGTDQALPVSTISRTKQGYRSAQENQGTDQFFDLILDQGLMEKTEVQINYSKSRVQIKNCTPDLITKQGYRSTPKTRVQIRKSLENRGYSSTTN